MITMRYEVNTQTALFARVCIMLSQVESIPEILVLMCSSDILASEIDMLHME